MIVTIPRRVPFDGGAPPADPRMIRLVAVSPHGVAR